MRLSLLSTILLVILSAETMALSVEDHLEEVVNEQIEEQVAESAEQAVSETVEAGVQDAVQQSVEEAVAADVAADVADAVGAGVADAIGEDVASAVASSVGEAVADDVADAVAGSVVGAVSEAVADSVVDSVSASAENIVENTLALNAALPDTVLDSTLDSVNQLPGQLTSSLPTRLSLPVRTAINRLQTLSRSWQQAQYADGTEMFRPGRILMLATRADWRALRRAGLRLQATNLKALNKRLILIESESELRAVQRILPGVQLRDELQIDLDHLYVPAAAAENNQAAGDGTLQRVVGKGLKIGLVDSAVSTEHPGLRGARIRQQSFIPTGKAPDFKHGTAIASVLVGQSETAPGIAADSQLYAAGVFFREADYVSASAESLIQALDWLAAQQVDVINLSLTGPHNELLQAAVQRVSEDILAVAAVGNAGPGSPPLFPAAYPEVVGITAVDRRLSIFELANRGNYVEFATVGVDVMVASPDAESYRVEHGTSIASAVAAGYLAAAQGSGSRAELLNRMRRTARDLGQAGYDEIFGYGLLSAPVERVN